MIQSVFMFPVSFIRRGENIYFVILHFDDLVPLFKFDICAIMLMI
jgi:phenylalanine-4-hydroxylase